MAPISRDEAYRDIGPHIRRIWDCMTDGYGHYRTNYPDQDVHRTSTSASIVIDLIFARIVSAFDEVPGTRPIVQPNQPRLLSLTDAVTLWFKKMDDLRQTANYPTPEALERDGGQGNLFKQSEIIVAGYILNEERTAIRRISFTPPKLVKPRWYIDVESVAQPIRMNAPIPITPRPVRLRVIFGPDQSTMLG